ncbi:uncharacterized protein LOC142323546 isoform X2 [Lycorma delicatula]|uniref:uncharacterized protein LOC142323546 isoform X2 n=1 Tax=Lycorma delicatula TaxID=130591 RepID=UPI003F512450
MSVKIASFICLITIFIKYSDATGSELPTQFHNEVTKKEQVDIGKSLILRQLVGTLASLMHYEAKKENPPTELKNHVDGIVIEAETPLKYLTPDHPRRKALLIIGEMEINKNKKQEDSQRITSNNKEGPLEKDKLENEEATAKLYKDIEDEKKAENLRRQEWTKQFLKHRQEELHRRQEWQIEDDKMHEEEVVRRQEWVELMKKKRDILSSVKPAEHNSEDKNGLPSNTLIHSLFDALEAIKQKKEI